MLKSKTGSRAQGVERASEIIDFIFSTGEWDGWSDWHFDKLWGCTHKDGQMSSPKYLAKPSDFITLLCCRGWLRGNLRISHPWIISLLLQWRHLALSNAPFIKSMHTFPVCLSLWRFFPSCSCAHVSQRGCVIWKTCHVLCRAFITSLPPLFLSASFYPPL